MGNHGLLLPGKQYCFRDEFSAEALGPRWLKTDTENKLSTADGKLVCAGGKAVPVWDDPRLTWPVGFAAAAGLTLEVQLQLTNTSNGGVEVGLDGGAPVTSDLIPGFSITSGRLLRAVTTGGALISSGFTLALGTEYALRVVLGNPGAYWYYSADGGQTWKLFWVDESGYTGTLYPGLSNYGAAFSVAHARLWRRPAASPVASDGFGRADSALTLGSTETAQPWTATTGTWGINGGRAYSASDADQDLALIDTGLADGIYEVTINGALGAAHYRLPELVVRAADGNNLILVRLSAGNLQLYKRDGGIWSSLGSTASASVDGVDYTLRAVCIGSSVKCYVDGVERIAYVLAGGDTKYAAHTKGGLMIHKGGAPATAARFDNFKVWG